MRHYLKSQDYQNLAKCARDHEAQIVGSTTIHADSKLTLFATGGYNDTWQIHSTTSIFETFILKLPRDYALQPWRLENEAAWLVYLRCHDPSIPVPTLLDWSIKAGELYLAEEFIDVPCLSDLWSSYTEEEKLKVAQNLSKLLVTMAQIRFDQIGGLKIDGTLGPTVEGTKSLKGRNKFHSPTCYDIGPYDLLQEYILACYDKEICYYTHAGADIDLELFEDTTVEAFILDLRTTRERISRDAGTLCPGEPFVLVHGDLQGRNIMMKGTTIAAVLDWEFAGSFPLSEILSEAVEVLKMEDEAQEEECFKWFHRINEMVIEEAKSRGWAERDVEVLASGGDPTVQAARVEMFPAQR